MVLAVIPARGGSKGIPRKNVRLMHGKPLIYYSIQNALACSYIDDVVVSSDDEEILSIAAMYGAKAMNRNSALAQDAVTLDPVIYDAVLRMEQETVRCGCNITGNLAASDGGDIGWRVEIILGKRF